MFVFKPTPRARNRDRHYLRPRRVFSSIKAPAGIFPLLQKHRVLHLRGIKLELYPLINSSATRAWFFRAGVEKQGNAGGWNEKTRHEPRRVPRNENSQRSYLGSITAKGIVFKYPNRQIDWKNGAACARGRLTKMRISGVVGRSAGRVEGRHRGMRRCEPAGWERGGEAGGLGPEIEYEAQRWG